MKTSLLFLTRLFLTAIILLSIPNINFAQSPDLGTVGNFALFTTAGAVSNTGNSQISGNIGSDVGAITGFDSVTCDIYNADPVTEQGKVDLLTAYNQLNGIASTSSIASLLGNGQILTAGVYYISEAASLSSDLNLDAQNDPDAVFIFRIQGAFSTTAYSEINLLNGALANNVYWQVEGAVSVATHTTLRGIIIANNGAISMATGSTFEGKGFSTTGAIAVDGIILPVTLIDFEATQANESIELSWTVANEFSLARYELQRSANGHDFYYIGSVTATNTPYVQIYSWKDNTPLPIAGFYRLKMIDIDGVFKYSAIIKTHTDVKKGISVYPNPVTGNTIQLQMYDQSKGDYSISLYNANGQKVMNSTIIHGRNDAIRSVTLNKNLPGGVYYLEVSDPEKNRKVSKLIINLQ